MRAFTLGGKSFNVRSLGSVQDSAVRFLDALPDGTLVSTKEVAAAIGFSGAAITAAQLADRRIMHGKKFVYGSKKTIKEARKILGHNG